MEIAKSPALKKGKRRLTSSDEEASETDEFLESDDEEFLVVDSDGGKRGEGSLTNSIRKVENNESGF